MKARKPKPAAEPKREEKPWTQQVHCPTTGTSHGSHGRLAEEGGDRMQEELHLTPHRTGDSE